MREFLMTAIIVLASLTPASSQNITKSVKVKEHLDILSSITPEGNLNSKVIFLADQLVRNIDNRFRYEPVVVTTFVNLDNMKETSSLGRLIAENLIHELQVRGWKVFDIRLAKDIVVKPQGEFSITRDIRNIRNYYRVNSVITGTYAITSNSVIVNARIIDVKNGVVVSTGQIILSIEDVASLLTDGSDSGSTIRIKGEY
ncbi:FlgO family outer membrane protein [Desulfurobacterium crinifex]